MPSVPRWFAGPARGRQPVVSRVGARVGDLQGPVGRIDPSGRISIDGRGRSVEWGVLADERWRLSHTERAVRQNRVDDTPVYETRMRVPTGDVIHRAGVVNDGLDPVVVIELENASANPVLVAVVAAVGEGERLRLAGDVYGIALGGSSWLRAERPAQAAVGGDDAWAALAARPPDAAPGTVAEARQAALVVTIPHRQRVTVAVGPSTRIPTLDEIVAGWKAVLSRAASLELSDPHLGPAWKRIVGDLILAAGDPFGRDDGLEAAEVAWWLDVAGLHREAERALTASLEAATQGSVRGPAAVALLRALASRELRADEPSDLPELAGPLVRLAGGDLDQDTARLVADALRRRAIELVPEADAVAADPNLTTERVEAATDVTRAAQAVVGAAVTETAEGLDLLAQLDPGREIDVRGLVTVHGRLSYSLRWHGENPALLWELETSDPGATVVLRAPSVDPNWESREPRGETLLRMPYAEE